jgi:hypothetical protein
MQLEMKLIRKTEENIEIDKKKNIKHKTCGLN